MRFPSLGLLLLACVAVGQAASDVAGTDTPTHSAQSSRLAHTPPNASTSSRVGPGAPVITIHGLCDVKQLEPRSAAASDKSRKAAICKTIVTRSEFDALANALQANMDDAAKRQLALTYAKLLVSQREFRRLGLDKDPAAQRALEFAELRAQDDEVTKKLEDKARAVTDAEIEQYYKTNGYFFNRAELLRVYVPKERRDTVNGTSSDAAQEAMRQKADEIQARAVSGADFTQLQDDAYVAAGIAGARPPVNLGKITANELPPNQRTVMDLNPGQVSEVIADNGYYIFKLLSKDTKPLPQVRAEITSALSQQKLSILMKQVEQSGRAELNDEYFPPTAAGNAVSPASFRTWGRGAGSPGFRKSGLNRRNMRLATPTETQQSGAAPSAPHN